MRSFALFCALAVAGAAHADTTLRYTVLYAGKPSGSQTTVIADDGSVRVSYTHRNNGRGPDLEEEIVPAADGTFSRYRLRGKSTFGAVLDERFTIRGRRASWQSASERGSVEVPGPAMYLPIDGSPEVNAMIVRATRRAAGGRIAALPGGELQSTQLVLHRIGAPGQERQVALHAISGLGLRPAYVWLLFAAYGIPLAMTEGVGKAFVSNMVPADRRGSLIGLYQTAIGLTAVVASVLAGQLWDHVNPAAPFVLGASTGISAAVLLAVLAWRTPAPARLPA